MLAWVSSVVYTLSTSTHVFIANAQRSTGAGFYRNPIPLQVILNLEYQDLKRGQRSIYRLQMFEE